MKSKFVGISADLSVYRPFEDFLGDMAALGVTPVAEGGLVYAVIAARSNSRWWLLPLRNRRAAVAGLEMLQPVTKAAAVAKMVARALAWFGPHALLGHDHVRLSGMPDLSCVFYGPAVHVAYFTGTDGPHRKTSLQIMNADGAILGYAKLSRASHIRPYIRNEAQTLRRVANLGLTVVDFPKVLSLRDDTTLTMLITDSQKSIAHVAPREPGAVHLAFLAQLRAQSGVTGAGPVLDRLARRVVGLRPLAGPDWIARFARIDTALRPVADTIPLCLAHGDFTPWNTFLQNGRLYVFDWEYAAEDCPVGFDLAHFLLSTTPPTAQPDSVSALTRALADAHFDGAETPAARALLLSLACHAVFYLGRLEETGSSLTGWPEGTARAAMIDRLLLAGISGAR